MNRNVRLFCCVALTIAGLGGCSSKPSKDSQKTAYVLDKIQGRAEISSLEATSADAALNGGGPTVYLSQGLRRYRLFFKTAIPLEAGKDYAVEGVYAQKAIDDIGDPDQGKNGYPLPASCRKAVAMAWPGQAFDVADLQAAALCARVKRYPARSIFLVTRLTPAESGASEKKEAAVRKIEKVSAAVDRKTPVLVEGANVQNAPLWAPAGGTVRCKLIVDEEGQVSQLATGIQLCEAVPWVQFRFQPAMKRGEPIEAETEVEVRFDPRK